MCVCVCEVCHLSWGSRTGLRCVCVVKLGFKVCVSVHANNTMTHFQRSFKRTFSLCSVLNATAEHIFFVLKHLGYNSVF